MSKHPSLYHSMSSRTLTAGWIYSTVQLFFLPGLLTDFATTWRLSDALINFIYYSLNFAFTLWIFRRFLRESLAKAGRHLGRFLLAIVLGFAAHWLTSRAGGMLLRYFAAGFANVNDQTVAAMIADAPLLMGLGLILMVPVTEECLFRGLIFGQLHPKSRVLAYGLSAAAFCAIHVVGYIGQVPPLTLALCALQYVPAGLILAFAYRFCGSIVAPILIHAAANAAAYLSL